VKAQRLGEMEGGATARKNGGGGASGPALVIRDPRSLIPHMQEFIPKNTHT
jgi:hypothetical protein